MPNYNKAILAGHLTRDPELTTANSGLSICKLGLAVSHKYTANNEKKEEVLFVDVTAFGKQAETIGKYMTKGKPILIEGRLRLEQWTDKDGGKRSKISVVLDSFQFLGSGEGKQSTNDDPGGYSAPRSQSKPASQSELIPSEFEEEEIPF